MKNGKKWIALALATGLMLPSILPFRAEAQDTVPVKSVRFIGMDAPKTVEQMAAPYSAAKFEVTYADGTKKTFPLSYKLLYKTNDALANKNGQKFPIGTPLDANGNPIKDKSKDGLDVYYISDAPDANSLLQPIDGQLYLVTHQEYTSMDAAGKDAWRRVPASINLARLEQNMQTGELRVVTVDKINAADANGIWVPCNGSLSPWNTHLSSEEYEPDARQVELERKLDAQAKQERINKGEYDKTNTFSFAQLYYGDETKANPYLYGYIPEVIVSPDGSTKVVKHYSTGRKSNEIMVMMPDNRTAYFGDDGDYTTLFMYVADREKDLSAGTLYASRYHQTSAENGGQGTLEWIKLGHATDAEVEEMANKYSFSDIFETSAEPKEGFTAVKQYSALYSDSGAVEYLKVKPGMEKAAAFLESRRYAAVLGATSEFNKMEGVAVNPKDNKVYIALSDVSKGMEKNEKDPADHIQVAKNKAGGVYELAVAGGQKDKTGDSINSSYVATSMKALLLGEPLKEGDAYGNTANPDKIANPDNLSYSEAMNTLFIGEDSGMHTNNYVWAYNLNTKELSRILSIPAGAEATGLQAVDDRNGFSYVMSNFQHPGDGVGDKKITAVDRAALVKALEESPFGVMKAGGVGYIQGITLAALEKDENQPVQTIPPVTNPPVNVPPVTQPLKPNPPLTSTPTKKVVEYVVKPGDVLWKIGRKYGVDWHVIAEYNHLKNPHLILVGQKLLIPLN
ncbi:MAG: DUF839 domain-containing protein [Thermicanus sp.]|nr:DUF839 domain-containing protein [Thermicanus sp.]